MHNEYNFESRAETPIDETETDLCRALWIAVALQAIIDATSKSRKKPAIKDRSQALQWLADYSDEESDLALVCDLAGIDFKILRGKFKQLLHDPHHSIDFRCLKKSGIDNRETESRTRYFARARKNERLKQERIEKQNLSTSQVAVIAPFCEMVDESPNEQICAR
jgi:hypothetical protein